MTIRFAALLAALALGACAEPTSSEEKPEFDPNAGLIDDAKADYASNRLTTIKGSVGVGEQVETSIDHPDYLAGHTMELSGGQTVDISVKATERGVSAIYGPAVRYTRDGRPLFRRALDIQRVRDFVHFELEVPESGTYLVVYGPTFVWKADYRVTVECIGDCRRDGGCFGDEECGDGTFCGFNNVVCVRAPCDAAYDVCQPQGGELAICDRDRACGEGLACIDGACQPADVRAACEGDDQCADGWCRCTDQR